MTIAAIITARGGSKRLPGKNLRMLLDKPLIAYSITAAQTCPLINSCFVSTEDEAIKDASLKWGAEIIDRPAALATDKALSKEAVRHALGVLGQRGLLPDYFVLLQPTSPLRTALHLQQCIESFLNSTAKSAVSVTRSEFHPYKMFKMNGDGFLKKSVENRNLIEQPVQNLPVFYRTNGAIYLISSRDFLDHDTFYLEPVLPFFMSQEDSLDIDTLLDFEIAEILLKNQQEQTT